MIKITGGEFRGRNIETPANLKTRPTTGKVRQALFNSIQALVPDARILDLFAGSGALGLEAISRGAKESVFVEHDRFASALILKNAKLFRIEEKTHILTQGVFEKTDLIERFAPFDVVFADPPYKAGLELKVLSLPWDRWLAPEGFVIMEWSSLETKSEPIEFVSPFLVKVREKKYGDTVLTHFQKTP